MATIRKRGERYHVQIRKVGHPTLTKSFRTKSEATKWVTASEALINQGKDISENGRTLADAINRYAEETDLNKYQKSVLDWWRDEAQTIKGVELGPMQLNKLQRAHFIEARKQLKSQPSRQGGTLAPATVNRRMSLISAVLSEALEWDWLAVNPARIKRITEDNERDRLLTSEEQKRLLKACKESDEPALYPFVVAAMSSGMRAGELISLQWRNVDLERGIVRVLDTKNGTNRAAPLRGHALNLIKGMSKGQSDTDFIFKNKTGFAPFYYRKCWGEVRDTAKLDDFKFHDLRHLTASYLAMAGTSQRELMEILGHKSAQMTKRYSHFFDDHVAGLGDTLSEKLFNE